MVFTNSLSSYYEKFLATGEVKCIDEEIPFEIPKGWEWTRIANISIIQVENSKVVATRMAERRRNLLLHPISIGDISSLIM